MWIWKLGYLWPSLFTYKGTDNALHKKNGGSYYATAYLMTKSYTKRIPILNVRKVLDLCIKHFFLFKKIPCLPCFIRAGSESRIGRKFSYNDKVNID